MALEIIGVGFGRTDTLSIYTALKQLGFRCCHMQDILEDTDNRGHVVWFAG